MFNILDWKKYKKNMFIFLKVKWYNDAKNTPKHLAPSHCTTIADLFIQQFHTQTKLVRVPQL